MGPEATILVNLSGRGDKDMGTAIRLLRLLRETNRSDDDRQTVFAKAKADDRAALVGYLPAGFPGKDARSAAPPRWWRRAAT